MTNLQRWLRLRGMGCRTLSREIGVPMESIFRLATPGSLKRDLERVSFTSLRKISEATGIRPGVLVEDAMGLNGENGDGETAQEPGERGRQRADGADLSAGA